MNKNINTMISGNRVRVSNHYAGYKSQYEFMEGVLFKKDGTLFVKIEINPKDAEQGDEIELKCWNKVVKM